MNTKLDFTLVASNGALDELASELLRQPWLVFDTEFMRERTYFPQLCVIQIATPTLRVGIDALEIDNWQPLAGVLAAASAVKVFHAARQDIEALWSTTSAVTAPIYDTQIVAAMLHGVDQIGYAAMVMRVLGITLDKSETRTDWSRRPLAPKQWQYALDDVRYLAPIFERQRDELAQRDRLSWFQEDFAQLEHPSAYQPDPEQAWRRIRDANRLSRRGLAALRTLAAWREEVAIERNLPRRWVLDDAVLSTIAHAAPESTQALDALGTLPNLVREEFGETLVRRIAHALAQPAESFPVSEPYTPINEQQKRIVARLRAVLEKIAEQEQLPATILASRNTLESIAREGSVSTHVRGWRRALVGDALAQALAK